MRTMYVSSKGSKATSTVHILQLLGIKGKQCMRTCMQMLLIYQMTCDVMSPCRHY